ncbi:exonuclease SbcC [Flavobacterium sp. HSC-61S13]|nr:SMC family ATPase [Flavobacterium sp. HSC-61S13]MCP1995944.1 exonuclease SbcC [Flavobacterium sp. HSC-61S13]
MLPIQLTIEGLYSYQSKQTIDFTNLTQSGLFGIFGGVGSGKSSILEAISLALYGETERLNSRDSRGYNMLNLKSDKVYIEFDFTNFEERKFKFTVSWKRKKKFEETTPMERLAYEWKNEAWIPMESADATLVLGLTYENFRRTIIIPQGKFKEFLELKGADRSKMMKEIFNLERFDLSPQVSNLQRDNNLKIENLKGVLSGFESISIERVQQQQNDLTSTQQQLTLLKNDFVQVEAEWKSLQEAQLKLEALRKRELELKELEQQKIIIDKLQADILEFETVEKAFKELINREVALENEEQQQIKSQQNVLADKLQLSREIKAQNQQLLKWQTAFEQLDSQKQKVIDLGYLETLKELELRLLTQREALDKGAAFVVEQERVETAIKKQIQESETILENLKSERIDASQWIAIGNWYQTQVFLTKQLEDVAKKQIENTRECENTLKEFEGLKVEPATWITVYAGKTDQLLQQITQQNQLITEWTVATELSRYASDLQDGEACPLCGSLEHPQISHQADATEQLTLAQHRKSTLEKEHTEVQKQQVLLQKASSIYDFLIVQAERLAKDKKALEIQITEHLSSFIWKEFSTDNRELFESKKQRAKALEVELHTLEQTIKTFRDKLVMQQELTQKAHKKMAVIEMEISGLVGQYNQLKEQIKSLDLKDYETVDVEAVMLQKNALAAENDLIEKSYKRAMEKIQELKPQLATKVGILETIENQLEFIRKNRELLKVNVEEALERLQFKNRDEVHRILAKNWNLEQERQRINQFQFLLQNTKQIITELKLQTAGLNFDQHLFEAKEQQYRQLQIEVELAVGKVSALEQELLRVQSALEKKKELIAQANALEQRALNLTTMTNLFKASGFVNYVSSIYLQNLCDIANVRFHRLTRNQLSLKLNENNEFEVLDYLNNGYARSVKTLSGGQGFQASLCLALALAESIQSLNKADKNFFFIDEGFGTQDAESINTVFETLQYLHKENRVVGIISHVEELQERIPSSISIYKNEEKGSYVVVN